MYEIDQAGKPFQFKVSNLTTEAQIWSTFILHNITPMLDTSSISFENSQLIWLIIT